MSDTKEITKTLTEILEETGISTNKDEQSKLVLWNDDHNSFEWVIICLATLLNFSLSDAEAAAWKVHLEGKEVVKSGSKEELKPYKKLLEERGLTVSIEE